MFTVVPREHVAVVRRRGRHHRVLDPGVRMFVPGLESLTRVDLRPQHRAAASIEAVDRDGEVLRLGLVLRWTVKDPAAATSEVADVGAGLEQLATATVRRHIGGRRAEDVIADPARLLDDLHLTLTGVGGRWGVALQPTGVTKPSRVRR
ncbi:SPFH domain-containing protein [uncultured Nocardioides sp.]|uniref:SPFH domain-containing protein n=1 Tax=uncultured Nocardioides sp. TaxID=198441 RepID=UPI0026398E3A|nr:SPFH domain-containing protein [uncultured Nocardioides sp.]